MANTSALQAAIDWVRAELARRHGFTFEKATVTLRTGGTHTFNAVGGGWTVVASVTNSSGPTSGGKKPVGKIRGAIADLYFLSLVEARDRLLVTTNREFHQLLETELSGALDDGIQIVHIGLPQDLAAEVARVTRSASDEMTRST